VWYRVTFAKDGAVRSCERVEAALKGGESVFYVDAGTKELAVTLAKKASLRLRRKQVQIRKAQMGQCSECNEMAVLGKRMCAKHSASDRARCRDYLARLRQSGLPRHGSRLPKEWHLPPSGGPRPGARYRSHVEVELDMLLLVEKELMASTKRELTTWLRGEIEQRERAVIAALAEAQAAE
jgi:hypothetical protein